MNEENILIIGDDLEQNTNPPAPVAGENPTTDDGSWLAGRKNIFAENFLEKHRSEFEDYQRMEREKISCAERFRALDAEITAGNGWKTCKPKLPRIKPWTLPPTFSKTCYSPASLYWKLPKTRCSPAPF